MPRRGEPNDKIALPTLVIERAEAERLLSNQITVGKKLRRRFMRSGETERFSDDYGTWTTFNHALFVRMFDSSLMADNIALVSQGAVMLPDTGDFVYTGKVRDSLPWQLRLLTETQKLLDTYEPRPKVLPKPVATKPSDLDRGVFDALLRKRLHFQGREQAAR